MSLLTKLLRRDAAADEPGLSPGDGEAVVLALCVFDSDAISESGEADYGAYAQGAVLKALGGAVEPHGGWSAALRTEACDGDLFEHSILGEKPGARILGDWIDSGTYGIDATRLDPKVVKKLKRGGDLGYTPYVISFAALRADHALATHAKLSGDPASAVGYKGYVTFDEAPELATLAEELHLSSPRMTVGGSECAGWQASDEDLREAGLPAA